MQHEESVDVGWVGRQEAGADEYEIVLTATGDEDAGHLNKTINMQPHRGIFSFLGRVPRIT